MKLAGIPFTLADPGEAENSRSLAPEERVRENSLLKAEAVACRRRGRVVVSADTLVVLDGRVYEKPRDPPDAVRMLRELAGRTHTVLTAVTVVAPDGRTLQEVESTRVTLARLTDAEIEAYVATGEPLDKAGSYAAQGRGATILERVDGCFYNVVGLPLHRLRIMLGSVGVPVLG